jgi:type IV secretory pathway TraG/TraD family ATPase VirD4
VYVVAPAASLAVTSCALVNDLIDGGFPVQLLAADVVGLLAVLGIKAWGARRLFEAWAGSRKPVEDFNHGSAKFATRKSPAAHGINKNHGGDGNAVYIGHLVDEGVAHHPIYYSGDKHLLTVGPTGSRKTIGQVLCNLARFRQSTLIFDIKGTAAGRTPRGREWCGATSTN